MPATIVRPSQAVVWVGITPLGAEHSTILTPRVLLGAAKTELAGITTLMFWPLENGMPAVNGLCGCAAVETMEPLVGPVAPAPAPRPKVTTAATRSPIPDSCSSVQYQRCRRLRWPADLRDNLLINGCTRSFLSCSYAFLVRPLASPKPGAPRLLAGPRAGPSRQVAGKISALGLAGVNGYVCGLATLVTAGTPANTVATPVPVAVALFDRVSVDVPAPETTVVPLGKLALVTPTLLIVLPLNR